VHTKVQSKDAYVKPLTLQSNVLTVVFWTVISCNLGGSYQHLRGTNGIHLLQRWGDGGGYFTSKLDNHLKKPYTIKAEITM
jgi:hypothetical protein